MREIARAIHEPRLNNSLVKIVISLHDSLTKIFNITDLCFAHHFLHAPWVHAGNGVQSTGFRSGLLGGDSVKFMKSGVSFVRSATVSRALCAGAQSYWKT